MIVSFTTDSKILLAKTFQVVNTVLLVMLSWNRLTTDGIILSPACFNNFGCMLSGPVDLFVLIVFDTTTSV